MLWPLVEAKMAYVGPDGGVESNLNRNLLGWGWIWFHLGSTLRPLVGLCCAILVKKIASVGPDRRVESKLNHNLLGWGWIGLHFGSMLWPLGTFLGLNPF